MQIIVDTRGWPDDVTDVAEIVVLWRVLSSSGMQTAIPHHLHQLPGASEIVLPHHLITCVTASK